jgi:trehalose 6-phosphate phosphatase
VQQPDRVRLPDPTTELGRIGLAALIAEPARAVVAVDFDGTLAPIVADPDDARAHAGAVVALERLAAVVGGVVVVTGRPAAAAVELGGFAEVEGFGRLVVLGHYGLERWDARTGEVTSPPLPPGVQVVRDRLPAVLADAGAPEGTRVEDKHSSLAVHVRRTDDPDAALALLRGPLEALAADADLDLQPGRMVIELRPRGVDKGSALRGYVEEREARVVLFAGDDLGDLPAYDAVDALRTEGIAGVKVCSASGEVRELADRADLVVDGPDGVATFLAALAAAIGDA